MGIYIKNMPAVSGRVKVRSTTLGPQWLSSTVLATPHETQTVSLPLATSIASTISLESGTLPVGVSIVGNRLQGTLPLVPAAGTNYAFTLKATDPKTGLSASKQFELPTSGSTVGSTWAFPLGQTLHAAYLALTDQPQLLLASNWLSLAARLGTEMASPMEGRYDQFGASYATITQRTNNVSYSGLTTSATPDGSTIVVGNTVFTLRGDGSYQTVFEMYESYPSVQNPGRTTAISEDGRTLAMSYTFFNTSNYRHSGRVAVFERDNNLPTTAFSQTAILDITSFEEKFGYGLHMDKTGRRIAVGDPYTGFGSIYFFYRNDNKTWSRINQNFTNQRIGNTTFGFNVFGSNTGNAILASNGSEQETYTVYAVNTATNSVSNAGSFNSRSYPQFTSDDQYMISTNTVGATSLQILIAKNNGLTNPVSWPVQEAFVVDIESGQGKSLAVNRTATMVAVSTGSNTAVWTKLSGTWTKTSVFANNFANGGRYQFIKNDSELMVSNPSGSQATARLFKSGQYLPPAVPHVRVPARVDATALHAIKLHKNVAPTWTTPAGSLGSFLKSAFTGIQLAATNGGDAVAFSVVNGALPAGVTMSASGAITGSPTATADTTASFTVRVTGDTPQLFADRAFTLAITVPAPAATELFAATAFTRTGSSSTITTGIDVATHGGLLLTRSRSQSGELHATDSRDSHSSYLVLGSMAKATAFNGQKATTTGFTTNLVNVDQPAINWSFRRASKFFDVVTWTGNGANRNIAHGLGIKPGLVIVKCTSDTTQWIVYHVDQGATKYGFLNLVNGFSAAPGIWNNSEPTATAFTVGTNGTVNASGATYVAYVFAHDTSANSVIKCGTYAGRADAVANYPTLNLGWAPRFLMIKNITSDANWVLLDTARSTADANPLDYNVKPLYANKTDAEYPFAVTMRPSSTGVQFRTQTTEVNNHNQNYIYMAIR